MDHALFIDVSYTDCSRFAPQIPQALFAMFQMMSDTTQHNTSALEANRLAMAVD